MSFFDADIVPTPHVHGVRPSSSSACPLDCAACDHGLVASARVKELEAELSRRRGLENVASGLAGQVAVSRDKYRRLKTQLAAEHRRRKAAEADAAAARDKCADVRDELQTALSALRHGRSREAAAASALSGQVGAVDQLRDSLQALKLDKASLEKQNAALDLGLQRARSQVTELEASVAAWRAAAARPEVASHAALKERVRELEEETALLQQRCTVADRRVEETAAQHAADVSRLEDSLRQRDAIITGLQVDMSALQTLATTTVVGDGGDVDVDGAGMDGSSPAVATLRLQLDSAARQLADQADLVTQLKEDNADLRALTQRLTTALEAATDGSPGLRTSSLTDSRPPSSIGSSRHTSQGRTRR